MKDRNLSVQNSCVDIKLTKAWYINLRGKKRRDKERQNKEYSIFPDIPTVNLQEKRFWKQVSVQRVF